MLIWLHSLVNRYDNESQQEFNLDTASLHYTVQTRM